MLDNDIESLRAAIAALEGQRAALGDSVVDLATAPLRQRLAGLQRPAGLQHRQVTVLFADVVGSTAMAESLGSEDTLSVLSETMQRMAAIVEAHQGRVLRFTGDGVKAAFGMDAAREDDAERAVRAGLAILHAGREQADDAQRRLGVDGFALRVGAHTGDVTLGAGVEADNTAMGAAVNIAARMEQSAAPGSLRISHDTWSQVRGLFEFGLQPPLQVKGVSAPMQTYLVHAALDRRVASVERGLQGLSTPMVGRDPELARLQDAVAQAKASRQLQSLTLLGEAGLGKSRLLREFEAALTDCRVLSVRAQPDGMLRLWGLLRSLLATQFNIADTDSADVARRKLVDGLSPCFADRGVRLAQLIGQLSGLDFGDSPHVRGLDPRALRDQALAAFVTYLQALAAGGAALPVLIFEDLHWADDGSLDLLQHLLAHADGLPLALVMTARPALLVRLPDWGLTSAVVQLRPLAAAHSDRLTKALLQHMDAVPPSLSALITGQAEGNPYYTEELVRRLVDDGVIVVADAADGQRWTLQEERLHNLSLPGTLVGLLQARLDALPAGQRLAARQASVIGHVFWDDALQALDAKAPTALPALQRAAFVRTHMGSDFEGTPERQFDHHLLHQVTYDTLLKSERRLGHGAAARWLAGRTKGRGAQFLAMTGEHAERAGETALAVDCFEQAGQEAYRRYGNKAAQAWLRRALELLGQSEPLRRFDLLGQLGDIADLMGDRSAQDELLAEAAALLEHHPDDRSLARLWFAKALLADRRGDGTASQPLAQQAFDLAARCGAAQSAALAQGQLAWLHMARHDYVSGARHIAIGLPLAGQIADEFKRAETEAKLLTLSGMVSVLTDQLDQASHVLSAVLARGEALGSARLQQGALDNLAVVANQTGKWEDAARWGERLRVLGDAMGSPTGAAFGHRRLAQAATGLGDCAAAIHWHEQSMAIFRAIGDRRNQACELSYLGGLHLQQGDVQAALSCCTEALDLFQTVTEPVSACEAAAYAAHCEILLGRPDAARTALDAVLERLDRDLATCPVHEKIGVRWTCHQVLGAVGDARAAPLLEQLLADVQARAHAITSADDCDRLIQAIPSFRRIVAAHAACHLPSQPG